MPLEATHDVRPDRGHDIALLRNNRGHDAARRDVLIQAGVPCLVLQNHDHWARIYVVHLGMVTVSMMTPRGRRMSIRVRILDSVRYQGEESDLITGFICARPSAWASAATTPAPCASSSPRSTRRPVRRGHGRAACRGKSPSRFLSPRFTAGCALGRPALRDGTYTSGGESMIVSVLLRFIRQSVEEHVYQRATGRWVVPFEYLNRRDGYMGVMCRLLYTPRSKLGAHLLRHGSDELKERRKIGGILSRRHPLLPEPRNFCVVRN
jgi:hypothetical protein